MPATLPYEVVDVFTDVAFAGNPLAVVLDADDLTTAQLQALAREFNLSETAFPLRAPEGADYRLRIFTPVEELPFAGHPSVGAAWLLHHLGRLPAGRLVQACGAGLLPVEVFAEGAVLTGGAPHLGRELDEDAVTAAVGLTAEDLDGVPRVAGCGIDFGVVPVRGDAVARAVPDLAAITALGLGTGVCITAGDVPRAHSRVFVPGVGEDPATGSAAVALGVLRAAGLPDGVHRYVVEQGAEVGRPSVLRCTVEVAAGRAVATTVAGAVVPVASGRVRVPA